MKESIQNIPLDQLAIAFVPVVVVVLILWKWQAGIKTSVIAVFRMLVQLLLVGYVLAYVFKADEYWIVLAVLVVMLSSSSWIALRTMDISRRQLLVKSFASILIGGGSILLLMTQMVLQLSPWYYPSFMIPLAGMTFANAMNSISLAGERLESELKRNEDYDKAKIIALKASLIPITNSLLAVGLVSLPGMMTGQILSGVSPLIAVRYQIMIMTMMFGSAGISSALFLSLVKIDFSSKLPQENASSAA